VTARSSPIESDAMASERSMKKSPGQEKTAGREARADERGAVLDEDGADDRVAGADEDSARR
jgi:hypothetical protein